MAALGLRCCAWAFSSCGERGLHFIAVHRLLIAVASHCRARALGARASVDVARGLSSCGLRALESRFNSCGACAELLRSMWDLPGPGIEPVSPALAGRFLTIAPAGKPSWCVLRYLGFCFTTLFELSLYLSAFSISYLSCLHPWQFRRYRFHFGVKPLLQEGCVCVCVCVCV